VQLRITSLQREARILQNTKQQLEGLPPNVPFYRSVGKAFVAADDHSSVFDKLKQDQEANAKNLKDCLDRQEYLERRVSSGNANLKDLTQGL
jgi:chaperonin cofactor prefoldin